ncbi:response regulator transcription factor [Clostridium grantii]|uniref:Stage 0 sporulation protein A homolog n=1 Tax=Clostridium grantii DSM 8605 TaxID=1121316 RepID=A0A1M5WU74_9CLOT|nr:response regulator transcription factor [Clostridium grantii]SHH90962.1 DNA-binding response regulator, OmpR family, contains REC and winged-helix (wHTH) domain [Clostridium grantii DSM 8605]
MNILLVDDEKLLVKGLRKSLEKEGYTVFVAYDGKEALKQLKTRAIDFILLDLMLPEIDGMTLCKRIREDSNVPIIMLTAKDDYIDKILGLEFGADDYVTKPFHTRELITRIKVICRRVEKTNIVKSIIESGDLCVNEVERTVCKKGNILSLTAKEFDILLYLIQNKSRVFSREQIFELVWDEISFDTRTVDVHIKNLRSKIEDKPSDPKYIITKWGVGYYFRKDSNHG